MLGMVVWAAQIGVCLMFYCANDHLLQGFVLSVENELLSPEILFKHPFSTQPQQLPERKVSSFFMFLEQSGDK
jgi:hypothetical protein